MIDFSVVCQRADKTVGHRGSASWPHTTIVLAMVCNQVLIDWTPTAIQNVLLQFIIGDDWEPKVVSSFREDMKSYHLCWHLVFLTILIASALRLSLSLIFNEHYVLWNSHLIAQRIRNDISLARGKKLSKFFLHQVILSLASTLRQWLMYSKHSIQYLRK